MNLLPPMLPRIVKRKLRNPRRTLFGNDLQRLHHPRHDLMLQTRVQVLHVLAHDHKIDVRIVRLQSRQALHRPKVRKQLKFLPQRHIDRSEATANRRRHRPLQRHPILLDRVIQRLRNVLPRLLKCIRARIIPVPLEPHSRRRTRRLHNASPPHPKPPAQSHRPEST